MSNTNYQITDDGFGIHTFELTKSGISRAEFDRIVSGDVKKYYNNKTGSMYVYPMRKGVRIFLNCVNPNLYNIRVIVSAKKLIDEYSKATAILNINDDFDLLGDMVNDVLLECLGEGYTLNGMCLSRVDLCVNVMLSEKFSAERYIKLVKKSMMRIDNDNIDKFDDSAEKNKHSFRVRTGRITFTAYDKYYQLEDIGENYTKESESLLRLELAIDSGLLLQEKIAHEISNLSLLRALTIQSREVFQRYIENHFFDGDYYSADEINAAINFSDYNKIRKKNMHAYLEMQLYKHSFNSIVDELVENGWTDYRLKHLILMFEGINVYPVSMPYRDKHGDKWVPGLRRIFKI